MAKLAKDGKTDIVVREKALELTRYLPPKDWRGQVHALFEYVRDGIRYIHDIWGVETLHTPREVMRAEQGDCDDKSILLAALLESIGHPARFAALGFARPGFEHVIVQTRMLRKGAGLHWLSLDATEPVQPGWEPPNVRSRMVVNV